MLLEVVKDTMKKFWETYRKGGREGGRKGGREEGRKGAGQFIEFILTRDRYIE